MKQICRVDELRSKKAMEFNVSIHGQDEQAFVIYYDGRVFAYYNRCPHTGVTLNWLPDQFFDSSDSLIQCAVHGALFQPADGLCVHGPCLNQSLQAIEVNCEQGWVVTNTME